MSLNWILILNIFYLLNHLFQLLLLVCFNFGLLLQQAFYISLWIHLIGVRMAVLVSSHNVENLILGIVP